MTDEDESQEHEFEPLLDPGEYAVAQYWYQEWSSVCRLVATLAFAAIAITIASQTADNPEKLFNLFWLKWSWLAFGMAGTFAGVSMLIAYIWMDFANRSHMPSLSGKLLSGSPHQLLRDEKPIRLGTLGWLSAVLAIIGLLGGLVLALTAAWTA